MLLLAIVPQSHAQQPSVPPQEGDTLDNVTISEAEARNIMKGLFDLPRLTHSLALGRIAKDERLTAFTDGFMQRNNIQVLTIGYIESDEFWPRIFRQQRLNKINKADNDNLLAAKIIFVPVATEGPPTGYTTRLELTGKTSTVYELLSISQAEVDSIAVSTSQQQLGSTTFATPNEAKETVVSALIAALQRVEESQLIVEIEVDSALIVGDTTEVISVIDGIGRNADLVVINTVQNIFISGEERVGITYSIKDTLSLNFSKLEIFRLTEEDTLDVIAFFGLPVGDQVVFKDGRDTSEGWQGTNSLDEFVEAGNYLIKLTVTTDDIYTNGYESYEVVEAVQPVQEVPDYIYDYFVTDSDAWYREKESPYKTITPEPKTNILAQGLQVALLDVVRDSNDKDVAKMNVKSTGEVEFTTLSNITQVKGFATERNYRLLNDYTALKIPFLGNSSEKTYETDTEIAADKYFGIYIKVSGEKSEIEGHWISKSSLIWIDLIEKEEFLEETKNATKVGTKFTGNQTSVACNVCVRSALLILKEDPALFPKEGSAFYDPANSFDVSYPKGYITNPGQAKNIKEDFDILSSKPDLSSRFTKIEKKDDEDWEVYFKGLQDKADAGGIIVGTLLSSDGSSGHVMMITPGGLIDISESTQKWGESFARKSRNVLKVPRVLECGTGARNNEAPLCRNVDYVGATKRLKWYEYN
ncbi:hypothetical protein RT717_27855 [Imperialibacter roseus]|uniref:Uncharacterized protein n=1 Tax=Imperialibacter roseus TaxID=1324217 RepID=A0ABZ0IPC5_9BACT|nr:hypothetical protein [Imperialibacter roseus]WOK06888.1 hypothetical protein RT717_27855 [Imperialibacter roseus]